MVDVHTADHSSLFHVRHAVDDPRNASNLCADLSNDLAHNQAQILAVVNRARQDSLRHDGDLLCQKPLQVWIEVGAALSPGQQQNDNLNVRTDPLNQLLSPDLDIGALDGKHGHRLRLIIELKEDFFEHHYKSLCLLMVS